MIEEVIFSCRKSGNRTSMCDYLVRYRNLHLDDFKIKSHDLLSCYPFVTALVTDDRGTRLIPCDDLINLID